MYPRSARDPDLLDALDRRTRISFDGFLWRVVREGRDPLEPSPVDGRWNMGFFEVVYTAFEENGAMAEVDFHLSRQPVFPSKYRARLYKVRAVTKNSLRFNTVEDLRKLGVDPQAYKNVLYERTQEIGDAAAFLGCDALIAPNARWGCLNMVLIVRNLAADALEVVEERAVDIQAWREANRRR